VLEALARVGALNAFGHPARSCSGSTTRSRPAQATQRDRITGQTSLFDWPPTTRSRFERPLPDRDEVPVRERLRWEKELLGLYLSEHPMGEVAEQVGHYVTAYSSDLRDESLDGQRVVVGGIVTGLRTVVTKARRPMAIATIEDLQGSIEVVVFPRLYEQTRPVWVDGASCSSPGGSITRARKSRCSPTWQSIGTTPSHRARTHSPARSRRGTGEGADDRSRQAGRDQRERQRLGLPRAAAGCRGRRRRGARPDAADGVADPGRTPRRPGPTAADRAADAGAHVRGAGRGPLDDDRDTEPAVPDEARERILSPAASDANAPVDARAGAVLHVRFARHAAPERLVGAMEAFKAGAARPPRCDPRRHPRPGPSGGEPLPMELRRGVAYDAELLAEVRRRLGRRRHRPSAGLIGPRDTADGLHDESSSWYSARTSLTVSWSRSSSRAIWLITEASSAVMVPFEAPIMKHARSMFRRCSAW
jgi:hypothetical protein